jgi:hypothetical protein
MCSACYSHQRLKYAYVCVCVCGVVLFVVCVKVEIEGWLLKRDPTTKLMRRRYVILIQVIHSTRSLFPLPPPPPSHLM